ncbi:MAG: CBS domain-containing protein [Planctomycetes bacterium]|nr:CBS domain-containing protein [Planctomycetota bacterium]NOG53848.1 CBS domain-containing protein [Planctomycetota bacterium]
MGQQDVVGTEGQSEQMRVFMKHLLADLRALEQLLEQDLFETEPRRIGVEQELVLVDEAWRPVPVSMAVIHQMECPEVTTELASFNIEFNLDPMVFSGRCLSTMEQQITEMLWKVRHAARQCGAQTVMTGILPTLKKSDLGLENMTPKPRYYALNEAMARLRGGSDIHLQLTGTDDLIVKHDSIMLEACNTSFQAHFQVTAQEFPHLYNMSQLMAAPVLAAAANSPLLFGKRLWKETRIAVFQQAVETRKTSQQMQERRARVSFGDRWVTNSAVEVFREDVARMRVLLGSQIEEDPFAVMAQGKAPRLSALQMHNGTVYRWMRPCYGITDGKPHLRIENRVLPSGPTAVDEVANAAFWFGLVLGGADAYGEIHDRIPFDTVRTNFMTTARRGLEGQVTWLDGKARPADELIKDELLALSRAGLEGAGVDTADIDRYLGVLEERVTSGRTGSRWMLDSFDALKDEGKEGEVLGSLTSAIIRNQVDGLPVHEWPLAEMDRIGGWKRSFMQVDQYMTTDIFTVHEDELVNLVACLMDWAHVRHVPVEDDDGRLVGLVSYRTLLRLLAHDEPARHSELVPVKQIMLREPVTIPPETSTVQAINLMRRESISCLPVVKDERLVGIITERDFMGVAAQLLEHTLREK